MIYIAPLTISLCLHKQLIERGYQAHIAKRTSEEYSTDNTKRFIRYNYMEGTTVFVDIEDTKHVDFIIEEGYDAIAIDHTGLTDNNPVLIEQYERIENNSSIEVVTILALDDNFIDQHEFGRIPTWVEVPPVVGILPTYRFTNFDDREAIASDIKRKANSWLPASDVVLPVYPIWSHKIPLLDYSDKILTIINVSVVIGLEKHIKVEYIVTSA